MNALTEFWSAFIADQNIVLVTDDKWPYSRFAWLALSDADQEYCFASFVTYNKPANQQRQQQQRQPASHPAAKPAAATTAAAAAAASQPPSQPIKFQTLRLLKSYYSFITEGC